ncbi:MAG: phosphoglycerate kinase [Cyclobacteriaceae bacterium]|nr:phosphoglycerate kinase [Cyclobacteriaceae bacterium]
MKTVDSYNFQGKKALIRVDFNVPLNDKFEITDDNRLKAALPTINKILKDGGSVILMSHLGRPKEGPVEKYSLKHVVPYLSEHLNVKVQFADDCIGDQAAHKSAALQPGEVLLLENLRFYKQEEKGDVDFAGKLASYGDVWVNDAFGTAHRAHASTAVMAQFFEDKVCGYVIEAELVNAEKVLKNGEKPLTAIMGGAKISDKILIIENLLDRVDNLIIGGGMAYTFFKAKGGNIGNSLCESEKLDLAKSLMEKAKSKGVNLLLPIDSVTADKFDNNANIEVADNMNIKDGYMGLDIGPKAIEQFKKVISESKTVLWNGPMGVFEMSNFAKGTKEVAAAVVAATEAGGFSLIGGGDSAAAVNILGYGEKVSYVSTGGGALLEYMEGKTLPGVAALEE